MTEDKDPLDILAREVSDDARRRKLVVIACTADHLDCEPPGPYLDCDVTGVAGLVESIGLPAVLLTRILFDPAAFDECQPERAGQCSHLFVGFSYGGQNYWACTVTDWFEAMDRESHSSWADDDEPSEPTFALNECDRERLEDFAANHASLKDLQTAIKPELERQIRMQLPAIADELGLLIPQESWESYRARFLIRQIGLKISTAQTIACHAIDDDLDAWGAKLIANPAYALPVASQREQFCKKMLTEELGFPAPRGLCERLRKHADGMRRAGAQGLF